MNTAALKAVLSVRGNDTAELLGIMPLIDKLSALEPEPASDPPKEMERLGLPFPGTSLTFWWTYAAKYFSSIEICSNCCSICNRSDFYSELAKESAQKIIKFGAGTSYEGVIRTHPPP